MEQLEERGNLDGLRGAEGVEIENAQRAIKYSEAAARPRGTAMSRSVPRAAPAPFISSRKRRRTRFTLSLRRLRAAYGL